MKKIELNNARLKAVLKQLREIAPTNPTLPVMLNVKLSVKADNTISFLTTDLEVTIIAEMLCVKPQAEDFEFLMPFDFLYKVCELNGDVPIHIILDEKGGANIKGSNDTFKIGTLDNVEDYPKLPEFPADVQTIKVNKEFLHWVGKAVTTVSDDMLRPSMTKVCLDIEKESITVVSTNRHALLRVRFDIESAEKEELLLGSKFIKALATLDEAEIYWSDNHIAFKADMVTVMTLRIPERFPQYKAVIPQYVPNLELNSNEFQLAIKKAAIAAPKQTGDIRLNLKGEIGTISLNAADDFDHTSKIDLPADFTGTEEAINFSVIEMMKLLNQISFKDICLAIDGKTKPILITTPEDPNYLGLIMPLMVP